VNEILNLATHLQRLQQVSGDFYTFLMQSIADEMDRFNAAM
jgi:hypothetical protein